MHIAKRISLVAFCVAWVVGSYVSAEPPKVQGVWKVVEATAGTNTMTNIQPALWIFTKKHYSVTSIQRDKPRPELPQNATDAEKVAAWAPFAADAGTYEATDRAIVYHPQLSKNPIGMAPGTTHNSDIKVEGNTLTVIANYGNALNTSKMVRLAEGKPSKLDGAWQLVEINPPNANSPRPQGLTIFTNGHYSYTFADASRPDLPSSSDPSSPRARIQWRQAGSSVSNSSSTERHC
jgi:hypothetical protein